MTLVTYAAGDNQTVLFEIDPVPGFEPAGVDDVLGRVRDAIEPAVTAAREVLERIKTLSPDGVDLKFGIKVSGQTNWVVAKAATEVSPSPTASSKPLQS